MMHLCGTVLAFQLPSIAMHPKFIHFNGAKYRLNDNGYYLKENWAGPGESTLHRAIWAFHNGPIPDGFHVHHEDEDTFNNEVSNLHALSASEHSRLHAARNAWVGSAENIEQLRKASEAAKQWHRSEAGHQWHREHGKRTWEGRVDSPVICQGPECGKEFMSMFPTRAKYCSESCKGRAATVASGKSLRAKRNPYKRKE